MSLARCPAERIHGRTLYLADYDPIELWEWTSEIREAFSAPQVREVSIGSLRLLARVGDVLKLAGWKRAPLSTYRLNNILATVIQDTEPLRDISGEVPYTMREGVAQTVQWLRQQGF